MPFCVVLCISLLTALTGFAFPVTKTEQSYQPLTSENRLWTGHSEDLFQNWNVNHFVSFRDIPASTLKSEVNHTPNHRDCPACKQATIRAVRLPIPQEVRFLEASRQWLDSRQFAGVRHRFIAPRTLRDEEEFLRALNSFFSELPLNEISAGHIRIYQEQRARGELSPDSKRWAKRGKGVGPQKINQELGLLKRIMKRADCWTEELESSYEPFQNIEHDIPRALTPEEQDRFLETASSGQDWQVVYWYALLNFRIGFSNQEMRGIRLGDFNIQQAVISVQAAHAKNRGRIRTVPLAPDAVWAIERLQDRAKELGASGPQHYLFPFCRARDVYDPDRPMTNSGIKKPFEAIRAKAGVPWFRQHDIRHTAITRWSEAAVPIPTIMSWAGHLTQKMLLHYTHISDQAARLAMNQVYGRTWSQKPPQSTARVSIPLQQVAVEKQSRISRMADWYDEAAEEDRRASERANAIEADAETIYNRLWSVISSEVRRIVREKDEQLYTNGSTHDRVVGHKDPDALPPSSSTRAKHSELHIRLLREKSQIAATSQTGTNIILTIDRDEDGVTHLSHDGKKKEVRDAAILILRRFLFPNAPAI